VARLTDDSGTEGVGVYPVNMPGEKGVSIVFTEDLTIGDFMSYWLRLDIAKKLRDELIAILDGDREFASYETLSTLIFEDFPEPVGIRITNQVNGGEALNE
jgi:hypothetical protein